MASDTTKETLPPMLTIGVVLAVLIGYTIATSGFSEVSTALLAYGIGISIVTVLGVGALFIAAAVLGAGYGSIFMAALKVAAVFSGTYAIMTIVPFIGSMFILSWLIWIAIAAGFVHWFFDLDHFEAFITAAIIWLSQVVATIVAAMAVATL